MEDQSWLRIENQNELTGSARDNWFSWRTVSRLCGLMVWGNVYSPSAAPQSLRRPRQNYVLTIVLAPVYASPRGRLLDQTRLASRHKQSVARATVPEVELLVYRRSPCLH